MTKELRTAKELFSSVNLKKISEIEKVYAVDLNKAAALVFSQLSDESVMLKDCEYARLLTYDEVIDAPVDMCVDFAAIKVIPFIDFGDNDYLAYDVAADAWCRFNIVDEIRFDRRKHVTDFFKS